MKRPILYWVILFILGEVFCKVLSISQVFVTGVCMLPIFIIVIMRRFQKKNRLLHVAGAIFFVLGVFCMHSWEEMMTTCDMNTGDKVTFLGKVLKQEEGNEKVTYLVKTTQLNEDSITVYLQMQLQQETDMLLGSVVAGQGEVKQYANATNPGGYDEENYQQGNGIMLAVKNVSIYEVRKPVFAWREYLNKLQNYFADIYTKLFDEQDASLAVAMVLGEKSNLDKDVKELYQRNGIAHLIAISGLHIAMIGGLLYRMLRKMTGSYPVSAAVGILFIVAYGVMTGLSSATLRAIIMLVTSVGADVSGRRYDAMTAISIALFFMLVQNPYQITQVGFLLSFGAVMGIALIHPVWKKWFPAIPKCLDGLFVSISVQLALFPILLYYFYEVPVYGIFLNVIVVPVMNGLLVLLLLCAMLGSVSIEIAMLPSVPAGWIFSLYEWLCKVSENLPGHTFCTGRPGIWWMILYYLVTGVTLWFAYRKDKRGSSLGIVLFCLLSCAFLLPGKLQICMFDVGQGDGTYIRTPHHKHILVDGGSSSQKKVGTYVLKNGLKYYGGNVIDYVFVSHSDSDHYSGILELLEEETIRIRNVVLPAITNPDDAYMQLENLALQQGCKVYYMKRGDSLQIDGVTFRCLNPLPKEYEDKNTGSIVLQMTYHAFDILLTGDMDHIAEQDILYELQDAIEVLKVAHHGSATSSSDEFLRRIRPELACISVGEKNTYGHPAKEVMERLTLYTQKIYLTKECGAITIETDGNEYTVSTYFMGE